MFDWLRNLLMPTPALVGVTAGRATLPAVMAFSEEGGGEQPPAEEKPAEPPAAEAPVETPAEAPAPEPAPQTPQAWVYSLLPAAHIPPQPVRPLPPE